jgi:CubicO group peptidase (beta-lactamase class C family)
MQMWRLDPDVDPQSVGMDPVVLDDMAAQMRDAIASGELFHGAQLAVYRGGRRVLDIGGGIARARTAQAVRPDTMFVVFSATKGLAAVAMWRLYERRAFHFDEAVATYWPEFAAKLPEKQAVTIRHVMSHRGGFPLGPAWLTARYWNDRAAIARAMEEIPLRWTPGARNGYHAMNFGHMVNELILRAGGRDTGALLREQVFEPLGLRDIYVGLEDDPALEARVAWVAASAASSVAEAAGIASAQGTPAASPRPVAIGDPANMPAEVPPRYLDTPELAQPFNRPDIHRAVLPAAGGIATARDLAAVYAPLALGGSIGEVAVLRTDSLDHAATPTNRSGDLDETLRVPIRWGTGWHLGAFGRGSTRRTFGHGGAGGQVAFADRDRALAFAFVTTGQRHTGYLAWRTKLQGLAFSACRD